MRNPICLMRKKKKANGLSQENLTLVQIKKLQTFVLKIIIQDILVFVKMIKPVRFHI